jgi:hypothetical protein
MMAETPNGIQERNRFQMRNRNSGSPVKIHLTTIMTHPKTDSENNIPIQIRVCLYFLRILTISIAPFMQSIFISIAKTSCSYNILNFVRNGSGELFTFGL